MRQFTSLAKVYKIAMTYITEISKNYSTNYTIPQVKNYNKYKKSHVKIFKKKTYFPSQLNSQHFKQRASTGIAP